jgi:hypothetical protein
MPNSNLKPNPILKQEHLGLSSQLLSLPLEGDLDRVRSEQRNSVEAGR